MTTPAQPRFNRGDRAILIAALFWGTIWYPVRALDAAAAGHGALAMLISDAVILAFGIVLVIRHAPAIRARFWAWLTVGLTAAGAYTLYVEGLLTGHIGRVLILFYLMPVWATALERVFLGIRLTLDRTVTLVLGLSGLAVMVGADLFAGALSVADVLAVASGICFAVAVTLINRTQDVPVNAKVGAIFVATAPVYLVVAALPGGTPPPAFGVVEPAALIWAALHAVVWFVPAWWLSIWGANHTLPGRAAVFFMAEVLLGIATAALFAGEVISSREAFGAVLVIVAGLVEGIGLAAVRPARRG